MPPRTLANWAISHYMMTYLRKMIPTSIKQPLKRMLGYPPTRLHSDWSILRAVGPVSAPHTVIDVGCHHGWFTHCWLDWNPAARVIAFDADEESIGKAISLYGKDDRINFHLAGLGAVEGQLDFLRLSEASVCNSFLKPSQENFERIGYSIGMGEVKRVPVKTLDSFFVEHSLSSIHLLKIDVQGFELEVLAGASRALESTAYVFVESSIVPMYEGGGTFGAVVDFMLKKNFHLMNLRTWHRGNGVLVESDLLFRKNGLEGAMFTDRDRVYLELMPVAE